MRSSAKVVLTSLTLLLFSSLGAGQSESHRDGTWHAEKERVWNNRERVWVSPEQFWRAYAQRKDGLTWGEGAEYPDYNKVQEGDTFLVQTPDGKCLMEFFHARWRRANDVRRWDPKFNQFSGCATVFKF